MILSDVVPLVTKKPTSAIVVSPYKDLERHYTTLSAMEHTLGTYMGAMSRDSRNFQAARKHRDNVNAAAMDIAGHFDDQLVGIALAHPGEELPEGIKNYLTLGSVVAQAPQIALEDVRKIADILGFLVLPFAYLHPEAYQNEGTKTKDAIHAFTYEGMERWYTPYVLTPPVYYNVEAHVSSEEDLPVYSGPLTAQAIMALSMSLPMFRAISQNLGLLAESNREIRARFDNIKKEIRSVADRLTVLETYVESQIREKVRKEEEARQEAERQAERARLRAYEPLLIGIPKGRSVTDNGVNVIAGPCWGPDFPDIVFTALGLTGIPGQRKAMLEKAMLFATANLD